MFEDVHEVKEMECGGNDVDKYVLPSAGQKGRQMKERRRREEWMFVRNMKQGIQDKGGGAKDEEYQIEGLKGQNGNQRVDEQKYFKQK